MTGRVGAVTPAHHSHDPKTQNGRHWLLHHGQALPRAAHVGAVPQKRRRGRARAIHSRLYSYTGQQRVSLLHRGKTSRFWAQLKRHTGNTAANRTGILTTVPPPPHTHTQTYIHTHQPHGDTRGLNALRNASVSETITC